METLRNKKRSSNGKDPKIHKRTRDLWSNTLFILKEKKCQTIPPGTLNVFYILVIHTDNAQVIFVLIEVCQPGGAVINFFKITRNQNQTAHIIKKPFVILNFCKQNLSRMNCIKTYFTFKIALVWDNWRVNKSSQTRAILKLKNSQF